MQIRSLAYRTDIALLRAGGSAVADHDDHVVIRTPDNPTFWWGNFVLIPELPTSRDDVERGLGLFREAFPDADHVAIGVDVVTAEGGSEGTLAEHGLEVACDPVLTASALPSGGSVPGVTIRPLLGDRDWAEQTELTMTDPDTGDTQAARAFTLGRIASQRALVEGSVGHWLGAFVDGALRASLGIFGAGDSLARFQDVRTHPDWRRRGLASALIAAASSAARDDLGADTLVIVADAGSDADRLYRSLGFTAQQDQLSLTRPPAGE